MELNHIDFIIISIFFLSMIIIGVYAYFKNKSSEDFFVAGGDLPWWLSGISHHVSGYSGAVFVAYAALAYTYGFSLYVWWAFTIGIAVIGTAKIFPVYWVRLRKKFKIQSPLEYLAIRYNVFTQQLIAWVGVILKLFDVGAKWAAIAILLNVTTGISFAHGILISGGVSLIYITIGGLWAVILTDLAQFLVQLIAGIIMFVLVLSRFGGWDSVFGIWDKLPAGNSQLFNAPYTAGFAVVFLFINFLSYNGGSWPLATRYISSNTEGEASKAAYLSGILYLVWPLILFFPMWAAPLILPEMEDPSGSYGLLIQELLPNGLIGLVIASLFANTMSMTSSDVNTISAVITRDILPVISDKFRNKKTSLFTARITTFIFTSLTIVIAFQYEYFGGVLGLIVTWFGALLGPIAVPLLFGLIPVFRSCGPMAAISSVLAGLIAFSITKIIPVDSMALEVGMPVIVSMFVYAAFGLILKKPVSREVIDLEAAIADK
ncbi:sodium:solute symporter family protein [Sinomicrobium weinanense]|uniref:Na+:solute symporter n=1 Tax=Sinomicrobium weinanense TaxID=2842200 RepID=A0A926Q100_9FLAO|nr:sodium:solute symporter family protein [Sinomicrobium weinanense]MBC9795218.1 Na+:solute symporter [Sinomicrobium weinanense]MBU3121995.1 Na+:solute symporter [Sinomicrobium weinanense]